MPKVRKNKSKKKNLSELRKSDTRKKTLNPFEIHVNRQKYNVIGRKLKTEKGLPGVSRSKAMKKRKATILQEYKIKDKANQFFDRRIGEKNSAMTAEDRIIARFTKERMKRHSKKNIFNLDDDEVLTHHGQTLSEIEKFENPASDDEDEEDRGKLEAEFVEDAHFGGGIFKKADGEKTSRKDLIEQLIAESKKRKAEKQRVREQTLELTEKLDTEWKELLPIVSASKKKGADVEDNKPDSYDTVMMQLKFEARGKPSDPLKSEETLIKEEEERLAKLEAEQLQRMSGFSNKSNSSSKHRSADDLDDGFDIESDLEEQTIIYDAEGRLVSQKVQKKKSGTDAGSDEPEAMEEETSEEEDDSEDGEEEEGPGDEEEEKEEGDAEEKQDDDEEDDEEDEEEEVDDLSDLKYASDSESEAEKPVEHKQVTKSEMKTISLQKKREVPDEKEKEKDEPPETFSEKEKKVFIEAVKKKFPNASQIPSQYEDLQKLLRSYSAVQQGLIVEHIMRSNHSGLDKQNKYKLDTLFAYLLQCLHDAPAPTIKKKEKQDCFALLSSLAPHLYDLAHLNPDNARRCIIEVLKEKQQLFRKRSRHYPGLNTLVYFKVVSLLFPASDFRHPVVTPALVFMCQMLSQCRVKTRRDIASGLYVVTLMLEYTVLSKKFSPSAINFLRGVIYSAVPKTSSVPPPIPPFKKSGELASLLVCTDQWDSVMNWPPTMLFTDLTDDTPIDNGFRVRALYTAVAMLKECHQNLESLPACAEIFRPIHVLLGKLDLGNKYPSQLKEEVEQLMSNIEKTLEKKLQLLVVEKTRAKALRLYEPHIEQVFDGKRKKPMSQEKQEHEKLVHKYKREHKAALREIRRDNNFLAKLKWKDTIKNDMERNQKVKEIFGAAATQQGELRKLKRKK